MGDAMQMGFDFEVDPREIIAEKMAMLKDFITEVREKKIPSHIPDFQAIDRLILDSDMSDENIQGLDRALNNAKRETRENGMWALVDKQWTKRLADQLEGKKVLEVMSGAGWLAKALQDHGVDVVATDSYASHMRDDSHGSVTAVENLEALEAIAKYDDADVVIMSWPPLDDEIATKVGEAATGKTMVYIGEGGGGCTANDEFHENFTTDDMLSIPTWHGVNDRVYIGQYEAPALSDKLTNGETSPAAEEAFSEGVDSSEALESFTVISESRGDFTVEPTTGAIVDLDPVSEHAYTVQGFDVEEYYNNYGEYPQGVVDINDIGFTDMVDGHIKPSSEYRAALAEANKSSESSSVPDEVRDLMISEVIEFYPELDRSHVNEMIKAAASHKIRHDSVYMDAIWNDLSSEIKLILGGTAPEESMSGEPLSADEVVQMATEAFKNDDATGAATLLKSITDNSIRNNVFIEIKEGIEEPSLGEAFEIAMEENGVFDSTPSSKIGLA